MSNHIATRRRLLQQRGRAMTLTRVGGASVSLIGLDRAYQPQELLGAVKQGDRQVEILQDEIAATGWPAPPRNGDRLVIDGRTTTVQGSDAVNEGATVIGHSLWVRG